MPDSLEPLRAAADSKVQKIKGQRVSVVLLFYRKENKMETEILRLSERVTQLETINSQIICDTFMILIGSIFLIGIYLLFKKEK